MLSFARRRAERAIRAGLKRRAFVRKMYGTDVEGVRAGGAMYRNFLRSTVIVCSLVVASSTGTFAQTTNAHQDADKAGNEAKAAGKEAGAATKDAAKATAKVTKKVAKKTGQVTTDAAKETATGTKKAAKRVKRAVTPDTTSATCNDGTIQTGKTKTTACVNHGGVRDN